MSNRTKIVYLLVGLVVVIGLWAYWDRKVAAAQQSFASPLTVSIGICDPHKAFQDYLRTKDLRDELRKKSDQLGQELDAKDKEIRSKTDELAASGFVPGSPEYEQRRDALVKLSIEAKNSREVSENELRREDMQITQLGYNDVYTAVEELAKKKQFTLVLSREQFPLASGRPEELLSKLYYRRPILYTNESLDITGEVVELLNAKYKLGRSTP